MLISAIAALALFASPDAGGSASAAAPAPEAKPAAEAKPKRVCKKQPDVSGSRLARKVCTTETPKAQPAPAAEAAAAEKPVA